MEEVTVRKVSTEKRKKTASGEQVIVSKVVETRTKKVADQGSSTVEKSTRRSEVKKTVAAEQTRLMDETRKAYKKAQAMYQGGEYEAAALMAAMLEAEKVLNALTQKYGAQEDVQQMEKNFTTNNRVIMSEVFAYAAENYQADASAAQDLAAVMDFLAKPGKSRTKASLQDQYQALDSRAQQGLAAYGKAVTAREKKMAADTKAARTKHEAQLQGLEKLNLKEQLLDDLSRRRQALNRSWGEILALERQYGPTAEIAALKAELQGRTKKIYDAIVKAEEVKVKNGAALFEGNNSVFNKAFQDLMTSDPEHISDNLKFVMGNNMIYGKRGAFHQVYQKEFMQSGASFAGNMRRYKNVLFVDNLSSQYKLESYTGVNTKFVKHVSGLSGKLRQEGIDTIIQLPGHQVEGLTYANDEYLEQIKRTGTPAMVDGIAVYYDSGKGSRASKDIAAEQALESFAAVQRRTTAASAQNPAEFTSVVRDRRGEVMQVLRSVIVDQRLLSWMEQKLADLAGGTLGLNVRTVDQIRGGIAVNRSTARMISMIMEAQLQGVLRTSTVVHEIVEALLREQGVKEAHAIAFMVEQALFPQSLQAKLANANHYDTGHLRNLIKDFTTDFLKAIDSQAGVDQAVKDKQKENAMQVAKAARAELAARGEMDDLPEETSGEREMLQALKLRSAAEDIALPVKMAGAVGVPGLQVAALQDAPLHPVVGDFNTWLTQTKQNIIALRRSGTGLVVFPARYLSTDQPAKLALAIEELQALADEEQVTIAMGSCIFMKRKPVAGILVLRPGQQPAVLRDISTRRKMTGQGQEADRISRPENRQSLENLPLLLQAFDSGLAVENNVVEVRTADETYHLHFNLGADADNPENFRDMPGNVDLSIQVAGLQPAAVKPFMDNLRSGIRANTPVLVVNAAAHGNIPGGNSTFSPQKNGDTTRLDADTPRGALVFALEHGADRETLVSWDIASQVRQESFAAVARRARGESIEKSSLYARHIKIRAGRIMDVLGKCLDDAGTLAAVRQVLEDIAAEQIKIQMQTVDQIRGGMAVARIDGDVIRIIMEADLAGELRVSTFVRQVVHAVLAAKGVEQAQALAYIVEETLYPESTQAKLHNIEHYDNAHLERIVSRLTPDFQQAMDRMKGVNAFVKEERKKNAAKVLVAASNVLASRRKVAEYALDQRGFYGAQTQPTVNAMMVDFLSAPGNRAIAALLLRQLGLSSLNQLAENLVKEGFARLSADQVSRFFAFFKYRLEKPDAEKTRKILRDTIDSMAKPLQGSMYEATLSRARNVLHALENRQPLTVRVLNKEHQIHDLQVRTISRNDQVPESALRKGAFLTIEKTPLGEVGIINIIQGQDEAVAVFNVTLEIAAGENQKTISEMETFAKHSLGRIPSLRHLLREVFWPRRAVAVVISLLALAGTALAVTSAAIAGLTLSSLFVIGLPAVILAWGLYNVFKTKFVITVDGLDSSGKREIAEILSRYYGYTLVDAALYYRAYAKIVQDRIAAGTLKADVFERLRAIDREIALAGEDTEEGRKLKNTKQDYVNFIQDQVVPELKRANVTMKFDRKAWERRMRVYAFGREITDEVIPRLDSEGQVLQDAFEEGDMTTKEIASILGRTPGVRDMLDTQLRTLAKKENIVAVGQTMGSEVFVRTARAKFFVYNDDLRNRLERKLRRPIKEQELPRLMEDLLDQDRADLDRTRQPIKQIADAVLLDTGNSNMEHLVKKANDIILKRSSLWDRLSQRWQKMTISAGRMLSRAQGAVLRRALLEQGEHFWNVLSDNDGLSTFNAAYGKAHTNIALDDVMEVITEIANSPRVQNLLAESRKRNWVVLKAALRNRQFREAWKLLPRFRKTKVYTIRHGGDESIYVLPASLEPREVKALLEYFRKGIQFRMLGQLRPYALGKVEPQIEKRLEELAAKINDDYASFGVKNLVRFRRDDTKGLRLMLKVGLNELDPKTRRRLIAKFQEDLEGYATEKEQQAFLAGQPVGVTGGRLLEAVLQRRLAEEKLHGKIKAENINTYPYMPAELRAYVKEKGLEYLYDGNWIPMMTTSGAVYSSLLGGEYLQDHADKKMTQAGLLTWDQRNLAASAHMLHLGKKGEAAQVIGEMADPAVTGPKNQVVVHPRSMPYQAPEQERRGTLLGERHALQLEVIRRQEALRNIIDPEMELQSKIANEEEESKFEDIFPLHLTYPLFRKELEEELKAVEGQKYFEPVVITPTRAPPSLGPDKVQLAIITPKNVHLIELEGQYYGAFVARARQGFKQAYAKELAEAKRKAGDIRSVKEIVQEVTADRAAFEAAVDREMTLRFISVFTDEKGRPVTAKEALKLTPAERAQLTPLYYKFKFLNDYIGYSAGDDMIALPHLAIHNVGLDILKGTRRISQALPDFVKALEAEMNNPAFGNQGNVSLTAVHTSKPRSQVYQEGQLGQMFRELQIASMAKEGKFTAYREELLPKALETEDEMAEASLEKYYADASPHRRLIDEYVAEKEAETQAGGKIGPWRGGSIRRFLPSATAVVQVSMVILGLIGIGLAIFGDVDPALKMASGVFGILGIRSISLEEVLAEEEKIPARNTGETRMAKMLSKHQRIQLGAGEIDSFDDMQVVYGRDIAQFTHAKMLQLLQKFIRQQRLDKQLYLYHTDDAQGRFGLGFLEGKWDESRIREILHQARFFLQQSFNKRYRVVTLPGFDLGPDQKKLDQEGFNIRLGMLKNLAREHGLGMAGVTEGRAVHLTYEVTKEAEVQKALEVMGALAAGQKLSAMAFANETNLYMPYGYLLTPKLSLGVADDGIVQKILDSIPNVQSRPRLPGGEMLLMMKNTAQYAMLQARKLGGETVLAQDLAGPAEELPAVRTYPSPAWVMMDLNVRNNVIFQRWFADSVRRISMETDDPMKAIRALRSLYEQSGELLEGEDFDYLGLVYVNVRDLVTKMQKEGHHSLLEAAGILYDLSSRWDARHSGITEAGYLQAHPEYVPVMEKLAQVIDAPAREQEMDRLHRDLRDGISNLNLSAIESPGRIKQPFSTFKNYLAYWQRALKEKPDFANRDLYEKETLLKVTDDVIATTVLAPTLADIEESVNALLSHFKALGYDIALTEGMEITGANVAITRTDDGRYQVRTLGEGYFDAKIKLAPGAKLPFGAEVKFMTDTIEESVTRPGYAMEKKDLLKNLNWRIAIGGPSGTQKINAARILANYLDYQLVDMGMLYRAIDFAFSKAKGQKGIRNLKDFMKRAQVEYKGKDIVIKHGQDEVLFTKQLAKARDKMESEVSENPEVMQAVAKIVRTAAKRGRVVIVGQNPFELVPEAEFNVYFDLSAKERASIDTKTYQQMPAPEGAFLVSEKLQKNWKQTTKLLRRMMANTHLHRSVQKPSLPGKPGLGAMRGDEGEDLLSRLLVPAIKKAAGVMVQPGSVLAYLSTVSAATLQDILDEFLLQQKVTSVSLSSFRGRAPPVRGHLAEYLAEALEDEDISAEEKKAIATINPARLPLRVLKGRQKTADIATDTDLEYLGAFNLMRRFLLTEKSFRRFENTPEDNRMLAAIALHEALEIAGLPHERVVQIVEDVTGYSHEVLLAKVLGKAEAMALVRSAEITASAAEKTAAESAAAALVNEMKTELARAQALGVQAQPRARLLDRLRNTAWGSSISRAVLFLPGLLLPGSMRLLRFLPGAPVGNWQRAVWLGLLASVWAGLGIVVLGTFNLELAVLAAGLGIASYAPAKHFALKLRTAVGTFAGRRVANSDWMNQEIEKLADEKDAAALARKLLLILDSVKGNPELEEGVLEVLAQLPDPNTEYTTAVIRLSNGQEKTQSLPAMLFNEPYLGIRILRIFPFIMKEGQQYNVPDIRQRRNMLSSA
ncbi:(d)CMP kinase [candidate division FCPU426 bacterium]|nr:(d)CMP kinase [candidate division FCPU426 bacterium]